MKFFPVLCLLDSVLKGFWVVNWDLSVDLGELESLYLQLMRLLDIEYYSSIHINVINA